MKGYELHFALLAALLSAINPAPAAAADKPQLVATQHTPSWIVLEAGQKLTVTCAAFAENSRVGSFIFRSRVPMQSPPRGLAVGKDGRAYLAEPDPIPRQGDISIRDNGRIDGDPAVGAVRFQVATEGWRPGVHEFVIGAQNRPGDGAYLFASYPVIVVIKDTAARQTQSKTAELKQKQTLALNVDYHCRRDEEAGFARFVRECAEFGVTRLNLRVLMMGYTEHPSKVRSFLGEVDPKHISPEFDLVKAGVKYCRQFGIEPFVQYDLFDTRNDRFAADNPRLRLVSRDGKEACVGALCYAYPEVREYMFRYVDELLDYGVAGFMFCTKSCHGMPLGEKFGFNDPIVAEFKRRHGVDVRTQPYDVEAWLDLQGEYILSWVKEATQRIHARGGTTGIALRGMTRSHYANLDWRKFVAARAADELHASCSRNEEYHLFDPDGLTRLKDYAETCRANGVKHVPYLFAAQGNYDVYRTGGLVAVEEELKRQIRHVRSAGAGGVLFHDMDIFTPVMPRVLRDDVTMAVIRAAGAAMKQPPQNYTQATTFDAGDHRPPGEILFNSRFRPAKDGLPTSWIIQPRAANSPKTGVRAISNALQLDPKSVAYIENIPAPFPLDSDPRRDRSRLRLQLDARGAEPGARVEVRVFRYLWPPLDYDLGHHQLHPKQAIVDTMLQRVIELPSGAAKPVQIDFEGGAPQTTIIPNHDVPSDYLLVRLTPMGDGPIVLSACSLTERK